MLPATCSSTLAYDFLVAAPTPQTPPPVESASETASEETAETAETEETAETAETAETEEEDPVVTVPYVIVGGGTAAYFAVRGIRDRDADAKVRVQQLLPTRLQLLLGAAYTNCPSFA